MTIAALMIEARQLWAGEVPADMPLGFIDIAVGKEWPTDLVLPPWPVIGLGPRDHPFAKFLDAVIESPVSAETVARQVLARPRAAAVTVQLLRTLPAMSLANGLTAESFAYALLQGSDEHRQWLEDRTPALPAPPGNVSMLRESDTLTVLLDRAENDNRIDRTMRDLLHEAFSLAANDPEVRSIALRAAGRSFSLGADLSEFGTTRDPATAHAIRAQTLPARMLLRCAEKLETHVQGACVGAGLELAAFSRRLTASAGAWFQLPELAMGVLPGAGGCVSLTRRIGRPRAALMMLSGQRISAKVALDWGLVDAIVD